MSRDDWERKVKKVTKLDPKTRVKCLTPPVREAMGALDQMKQVHGLTPYETHGLAGVKFGIEKWDKDFEYRIFVKDALLREETTFYPERILNDHDWMAVEAYAVDNIGVKSDIVYNGNLFRKNYLGCSRKNKCITRHSDGSIDIDNSCRQKCQDEASEIASFFTTKELKEYRKKTDKMV